MFLKFVLVFCLLCIVDGAFDKDEGEVCDRSSGEGICTNLKYCPSAINDIRNKNRPQLCSFKDSEPVVCCPKNITALDPEPSTTNTPSGVTASHKEGSCAPILPSLTAPKTGRAAWDKCIEYQQLVFPCVKNILEPDNSVRANLCHHEFEELIVGGTDAGKYEFSHMVRLGATDADGNITWDLGCDGALIDQHFVLTNAHCVNSRQSTVSHVLVGSNDTYEIKRVVQHPDYKPITRFNDIALLELKKSVPLDSYTVPACLPVGEVKDEKPYSAGWGIIFHQYGPKVLQKSRVSKVPLSTCRELLPPRRTQLDGNVHACFKDPFYSTCQGLNGVLQVNNKNIYCMYTVVGLPSFGNICPTENASALYTMVASYVPWIESVVWHDL